MGFYSAFKVLMTRTNDSITTNEVNESFYIWNSQNIWKRR